MDSKIFIYLFISFFILFLLVLLKTAILDGTKSPEGPSGLPDIPTPNPLPMSADHELPLSDDPLTVEYPRPPPPPSVSLVLENRESSPSAPPDDSKNQSNPAVPTDEPVPQIPPTLAQPRTHSPSSRLPKKPLLAFLKTVISNDESIEKFDENIILEYQVGSGSFPELFKDWETNSSALSRLCNFGFQVLQLYQKNDQRTDCSAIADDVVKKIGRRSAAVDDFATAYEEYYWVDFGVDLPRFLATYECIGDDYDLKKSICHPLITRIIGDIDTILGGRVRNSIFIFYAAMTRIITNYLFDEPKYQEDTERIKADPSILSIPITMNNNDDIQEGLYQDFSCISDGNVANYEYIQQLRDNPYPLYEKICRVFSLQKAMNLVLYSDEIFVKMCHPNITQMPMGMFDEESYTVGVHRRPKYGKYGTHIFPFIGLGVFKAPHGMFSVRIQRPRMAVCKLEDENNWNIALGCVQLRKLLLPDQSYRSKMSWAELVKQPGIISVHGTNSLKEMMPRYNNESFHCQVIGEKNLIGLWENPDILFWRQTYGISNIYTVREFGVVTVDGLVLRYSIHNLTDKDVRICVQDDVFGSSESYKSWSEPEADAEGFIPCAPKSETAIYWKMLVDDSRNFDILTMDLARDSADFTYDGKNYEIRTLKNSNYIVISGATTVGGSSKSKRTDKFVYGGRQYIRTPSLMYKLKNAEVKKPFKDISLK